MTKLQKLNILTGNYLCKNVNYLESKITRDFLVLKSALYILHLPDLSSTTKTCAKIVPKAVFLI